MLQLIQELDWTILHGIRDTLQCGPLDVLMPKITMLGDGGAVWLAASFGLMLSKKSVVNTAQIIRVTEQTLQCAAGMCNTLCFRCNLYQ